MVLSKIFRSLVPTKFFSLKRRKQHNASFPQQDSLLYRFLLDSPTQLFLRFDSLGKILQANTTFLSFCSFASAEEIVGSLWQDVILSEDHTTLHRVWNQCLSALGTPIPLSVRLRTTTNDLVYTEWEICALEISSNNTLEVYARGVKVLKNSFARDIERSTHLPHADLINLGNTIFWEANPDTLDFIYISTSVEKILGYSVEEWLQEPMFWANHIHPEEREEKIAFCKHASTLAQDHEFEYRFLKADGSVVWIKDIVSVQMVDGKPHLLRGIMTDITEQRQMEQSLKDSERRYRLLTENSFDLIAMHTPEGHYTYLSPVSTEILGYAPEELIGKNPYDNFHPDDIERIRNHSHIPALQGTTPLITYRFLHKNGEYRWLETSSKAIQSETGQVIGLQTVSRDVTDRMTITEQLLTTKQLLDTTNAIAHVGGWEYLIDTEELHWTTEVSHIYHLPTQKSVTLFTVLRYYHPEEITQVVKDFELLLMEGKEYDTERRLIAANGQEKWVRSTAKMEHRAGKPYRIIGTLQDITIEKRHRLRLEERERFICRILATSPDTVFIFDIIAESIVFITHQVQRDIGISAENAQTIRDQFHERIIHPDDIPVNIAHLQRLPHLADGEIDEVVYRMWNKETKQWRWFSFRATPFTRNSKDEVQNVLVISSDITHTKHVEEQLTKAHDQLKSLIAIIPVPINVTRMSDGKLLFNNAAFQKLFALPPNLEEQPPSTTLYKNKDEREHLQALLREHGTVEHYETVLLTTQAEERHVISSLMRIQFDDDEATLSALYDITERVKSELAIKESEERFRAIAEATPMMIWMADAQGKGHYFNQQWLDFVGVSPDEAHGIAMEAYAHPDDLPKIREAWASKALNPTGVSLTFRVRAANGKYRWILDTGKARLLPDGTLLGFIGASVDVHERILAEEAVRANERFVTGLINTMPGGAYIFDLQANKLTYGSPALTTILGYTPEEIQAIGSSFLERCLHPEDIPMIDSHIKNLLHTTLGTVTEFSYRFRHKQGHWIWLFDRKIVMEYDPVIGVASKVLGSVIEITNLKNAELELIQANERLTSLLTTVPFPIAVARISDGALIFYNEPFREFLHLPKDFTDTLPRTSYYARPEERQQILDQIKVSGRVDNIEIEMRTAQGGHKWGLVSAVVLNFQGEKAIFSAFNDITVQKNVQLQLEQNSQELQSIIDSMQDGLILMDTKQKITLANPALQRMFGYNEQELLTMSAFDLMPERFRTRHIQHLQPFIHQPFTQLHVDTARGLRADGTEFPIESSFASFKYGEQTMLLGILRDVTDIKQKEQHIAESEANLRAIMESSIQSFCLIDTHLTIKEINHLAVELGQIFLGKTLCVGDSLLDYISPEHKETFHNTAQRVLQGDVYSQEQQIPHTKGEMQWYDVMFVPTYNKQDEIVGITIAGIDISERKMALRVLEEMNEQLEERVEKRTQELVALNLEKDEFLGIAAHDLKNPLSGIFASAQLLDRHFPQEPKIQQLVKIIMEASTRMTDIITNLLDINRIETGTVRVNIHLIRPEILNSLVEGYHNRALEKGIILHYQPLEDKRIGIMADAQALHQIVDNLISNAVKYSPHWKNIWVRVLAATTAENASVVRIEVQDEGPGISAEDKKKLFGKFARLTAQPTGGENSTGLGLSIVKKLVEIQHGRVWCESESGKGATFIVEFLSATIPEANML